MRTTRVSDSGIAALSLTGASLTNIFQTVGTLIADSTNNANGG